MAFKITALTAEIFDGQKPHLVLKNLTGAYKHSVHSLPNIIRGLLATGSCRVEFSLQERGNIVHLLRYGINPELFAYVDLKDVMLMTRGTVIVTNHAKIAIQDNIEHGRLILAGMYEEVKNADESFKKFNAGFNERVNAPLPTGSFPEALNDEEKSAGISNTLDNVVYNLALIRSKALSPLEWQNKEKLDADMKAKSKKYDEAEKAARFVAKQFGIIARAAYSIHSEGFKYDMGRHTYSNHSPSGTMQDRIKRSERSNSISV